MSLRINSNVPAITAARHLRKAQDRSEHAMNALASGQRIVRPGDDAAGLAISENLRGQVRGLQQSQRNTESAISLIQVAEGGLNEQSNIIIRLRELSVQSASDTVSEVEREFLNREFTQLVDEFDRIAKTTTFGNKRLLEGVGEEFAFQVGPNGGEENVIRFHIEADSQAAAVGIEGLEISDQDDARDALESLDEAMVTVGGLRATFGAFQSRLQASASNTSIQLENNSLARSRIADADIAHETAQLVQSQVLQDVGVSVLAASNSIAGRASRLINIL